MAFQDHTILFFDRQIKIVLKKSVKKSTSKYTGHIQWWPKDAKKGKQKTTPSLDENSTNQ